MLCPTPVYLMLLFPIVYADASTFPLILSVVLF